MFCAQCGTHLETNAKFCAICGKAVTRQPVGQALMPETESLTATTVATFKPLGTKWLKFWNYFSLPFGGVLGLESGLVMLLVVPTIGIIIVPIAILLILVAILQFVVAYGLHNRKIWAWQWNWVVIVLSWFSAAKPNSPNSFGSSAVFWTQFIIQFSVVGLIWMWPNYVYWKKRRALFS